MTEVQQLVIESTGGIRVYQLVCDNPKQKHKNLKRVVKDSNDNTQLMVLKEIEKSICSLTEKVEEIATEMKKLNEPIIKIAPARKKVRGV